MQNGGAVSKESMKQRSHVCFGGGGSGAVSVSCRIPRTVYSMLIGDGRVCEGGRAYMMGLSQSLWAEKTTGRRRKGRCFRPPCSCSIPMSGLMLMIAAACLLASCGIAGGLEITKPSASETVMLSDDGDVDIEVDLGRFVVPLHGYLVAYVDGQEAAVYCPERTDSLAKCPSTGLASGGEGGKLQGKGNILRIGGSVGGVGAGGVGSGGRGDGSIIKPGERAVSIALIDAAMGVLRESSVALTVVATHEVDKELPDVGAFNAIIFSKDRACQLDQLLSSMAYHVGNLGALVRIQVLYTFSDDSFRKGYEELKKMHPLVSFHQEGNVTESLDSEYSRSHDEGTTRRTRGFKSDYLRLLDAGSPYTLHFVDDMVMIREWGLLKQLHAHRMLSTRPDVIAHSLRMHPGITYCYPNREESEVPPIDSEGTWSWRQAQGDWGYPMSLDAHIFRTPELASIVLSLEFSNPNSFEGALAIHCSDPENGCAGRMSSHDDAVVVNLPVNLVQTHWTSNRHMDDGPSASLLNTEFVFGRRLSSRHLWGSTFPAAHVPQPLVFEVGAVQKEKKDKSLEPGVGS